jgi:hypothetical protein
MNGKEVFRGIDFHLGSLDHHRIVNDTTDEEVLEIDRLLPKFNGLHYSCQYDTVTGAVISKQLNLKIEEVPKVTDMLFERLSNSMVQLSWKQSDSCQQTASFTVSVVDRRTGNRSVVSIPARRETVSYSTQLSLLPKVEYTVSVTAVADDARKSGVTMKEYQRNLSLDNGGPHYNLCEAELHSCILYIAAGVLMLTAVIIGLVMVSCMLLAAARRRKK